ncbi:MAG: tellurite resistance TerB family protein [Magnetococcales bacterium]|nr:tellurite resistance TerB family protein [Magnetococcales bacterium]MBF0116277.1 tellurite resistance TerB family protein [Magnetococcales bacterium]
MGFFDELKNRASQWQSSLSQEMGRFKNRDLMEAILAGCALVAAADGSVSSAEKQKMLGFVQNSDALKVFQSQEVIQSFQKHMGKIEFDFALGKAESLQVIAKIKDPDQARLLVRVCCAIGSSDGQFDEQEKNMVRTICRELRLEPSDFDL